MSEIAQTATQLIVIGRGRLIADTSVAEFIAAAAAGFLPGKWSGEVGKFLPATAGQAVTTVHPDPAVSLAPWTGFGLFCLYAAAVLGLAAMRMRRGDA